MFLFPARGAASSVWSAAQARAQRAGLTETRAVAVTLGAKTTTRYSCRDFAGLFQCGEGATVVCGPTSRQHNYNECTCRTPCHQNVYTIQESAKKGAPCPPAMPMPLLPPLPPTPPAAPLPLDSTSAPLHKGAHETHDHTSHAHGGHGQHGAAPADGHAVAAAAADPVNGR